MCTVRATSLRDQSPRLNTTIARDLSLRLIPSLAVSDLFSGTCPCGTEVPTTFVTNYAWVAAALFIRKDGMLFFIVSLVKGNFFLTLLELICVFVVGL